MSKYRVEIKASTLKIIFEGLFHLLLLLSLLLWQPFSIPWAAGFQWVLVLLLLASLVRMLVTNGSSTDVLILDEQGQCFWPSKHLSQQWQMTQDSRSSFFMLWLCLRPCAGGKKSWVYVARDQVTERDYRRLCRIVFYRQYVKSP